jgi:hypothetical protein
MEEVEEPADTMTESPKKQVHLSMIVILNFIVIWIKNNISFWTFTHNSCCI